MTGIWRIAPGGRPWRNALLVFAAAAGTLYCAGTSIGNGWLASGAILVAGLAAIRLALLLLFRALLPTLGVVAPRIAEDLLLVASCAAWCIVRLRVAGVDLGSLVTTSALITAVVAFAMQDTLGNVLGGLFLEFDRSLAIGDWIRLDDLSGRVTEVRWRHTAIRTRNGEQVIVPNSALMRARFTVIGNPDERPVRWRRWIWFEIDPEVPAGKVVAAARAALDSAEIDGVLREPGPDCVLMEPAAPRCRYALRYWLGNPQHDDSVDSAVRIHLLAALRRAGIALAQSEIFVHQISENRSRQASLHAREMHARTAALKGVDLFAELTDAELEILAESLAMAPFAAGDVVTRQGAVAHWLYLLISGEADVWVETPGAPRRHVAELKEGNVFGEMGMMTGEPRHATVTAKTDLQCYRLDKPAFAAVLRARPAISEALARVLASRSRELGQIIEEARADAAAARGRPDGMLARIRTFFGLPATVAAAP